MCGAYGRQKKDSEPLKIVTDGVSCLTWVLGPEHNYLEE